MVQQEVKIKKQQTSAAGLEANLAARAGQNPPHFKVSDLKNAIPAHCFERSTFISSLYLAVDLAIIGAILYFLHTVWNPSMLPAPLSWLAWALVAAVQGSVMTGVWVIAHECGHQAYSPSGLVNDTVGFIFHTLLMVPYFSWKISHSKHHLRTGSMLEDEVFVPKYLESAAQSDHPLMHTAPARFVMIVIMLVFGWPMYLLSNVTAHQTSDFVSHYWPYCSLFSQKERNLVLLSDFGLAVWTFVLYKLAMMSSFSWMFWVYGLPMIVTNACLVTITTLQHTHKDVPHYDGSTWNWLRGALTTVDRNYGPWNVIFHHIGDTHMAHHLFHTMPHYHAQEATEAIKKVMGDFYLYDPTPIYSALWENSLECFAVSDRKDGVFWWNRSQYAAKKSTKKSH